jgi:hypothetical protein
MMDAAELLEGCRAGDGAAWAELSEKVRVILASRIRETRVDRDDLLQMCLQWLLERGLDKVSEPAAFHGFLWRSIPRYAREKMGLKWTRTEFPPPPVGDDDLDPFERLLGKGITLDRAVYHRHAFRDALESLDQGDAAVLRLYVRYKQGELTYEAMIGEAGVGKRNTMASLIRRAQLRFLELLREKGMTV